ncbi:DUF1796 family putative cysteine peptidase [Priestia taiwanensis]|uniref:Uncharacterized protein n=1 Tax=Priestia taiwanensis TaxID=1347902 RepID=A0A917ERM0_9BACI|nr:hypothetical protein [Priestia taiwanensis]GGE77908.1 hypothetical protein GCM10007140_29470 [Priestia taiwanensis]
MNTRELKGVYSVVYSLGYRCSVANVLNELKLRKYSGIFDWIQTKELSTVT